MSTELKFPIHAMKFFAVKARTGMSGMSVVRNIYLRNITIYVRNIFTYIRNIYSKKNIWRVSDL